MLEHVQDQCRMLILDFLGGKRDRWMVSMNDGTTNEMLEIIIIS